MCEHYEYLRCSWHGSICIHDNAVKYSGDWVASAQNMLVIWGVKWDDVRRCVAEQDRIWEWEGAEAIWVRDWRLFSVTWGTCWPTLRPQMLRFGAEINCRPIHKKWAGQKIKSFSVANPFSRLKSTIPTIRIILMLEHKLHNRPSNSSF